MKYRWIFKWSSRKLFSPLRLSVILHSAFKLRVAFGYYCKNDETLFKSAQLRFTTVKRKGSIKYCTDIIHYTSISLVLWTSLCGAARCDSVLLQAHHSAHGMRISALCRSVLSHTLSYYTFAQWKIIYSLFCSVLFIICCCFHYCAMHLKEMYFNFIVYILYIYTSQHLKWIKTFNQSCPKT